MKPLLWNVLLTMALLGAALAGYDHWVIRPALRLGVVDLNAVYRQKEAEFTRRLTQAGSEDEREQAMGMARVFAQRLPVALEDLPRECNCPVLLRTAVAGAAHRTVDLTDELMRKLEAP